MNKSKSIGTAYETAVCRHLQGALQDLRIERRSLHGAKDMGDLYRIMAHGNEGIAECKAYKEWSESDLGRWRTQTLDERDNAGADFALLVIKRPRKAVGLSRVDVTIRDLSLICLGIDAHGGLAGAYDEAWVSMTLDDACSLMRGV